MRRPAESCMAIDCVVVSTLMFYCRQGIIGLLFYFLKIDYFTLSWTEI